jgi:hypothetical protein
MQRYRWKTWASKRIQHLNNNHEVAHKKNDHAVDSLRYFIMSRPDLAPMPSMPGAQKNPLGLEPLRAGGEMYVPAHETQPEHSEWHVETADEMMGGYW